MVDGRFILSTTLEQKIQLPCISLLRTESTAKQTEPKHLAFSNQAAKNVLKNVDLVDTGLSSMMTMMVSVDI
jgi:hypothetical protein